MTRVLSQPPPPPAHSINYFHSPFSLADRLVPHTFCLNLSQVKLLCKRDHLSTAYSCVFHPKGPSRSTATGAEPGDGGGGSGSETMAPVIYVHAPHLYYPGRVPRMPPCPKHGWQADGEVGGFERAGEVWGLRVCLFFRVGWPW